MSYDLRVFGADPARLELAGDELEQGVITASVVVVPGEIGLGLYADDDASAAERARDFEALLARLLALDGRVHDPQLGRDLGWPDVRDAARHFAYA